MQVPCLAPDLSCCAPHLPAVCLGGPGLRHVTDRGLLDQVLRAPTQTPLVLLLSLVTARLFSFDSILHSGLRLVVAYREHAADRVKCDVLSAQVCLSRRNDLPVTPFPTSPHDLSPPWCQIKIGSSEKHTRNTICYPIVLSQSQHPTLATPAIFHLFLHCSY